jgi:putative inorganic carbon (hco3(-)) transporter
MISQTGASALLRATRRLDATALSQGVFQVFVIGLASSITLSESALAVLTALWLWRLRDPAVRREQPWTLALPIALLFLVTLVSALASEVPARSLFDARGLLAAFAFFVTADALRSIDRIERFLGLLVILGAVLGLVALFQVLTCPTPAPTMWPFSWFYSGCGRARGPFSIYMTLAGVLTPILLVGLPQLLTGPQRTRGRWAMWLVTLAGLGVTYVRGAWVGFVAGLGVMLLTLRRGRAIMIIGLALVLSMALVGPERLSSRVRSFVDPRDGTARERLYMWKSGLAMWREHPWLGVGPGGVKRLYPRYALPEAVKKSTSHIHSSPLQILVERGVVGLAAWLSIWGVFFVFAWRLLLRLDGLERERTIVVGSVAAVAGFLVTGLTEWSFGDAEVVLVAWTLAALPFGVASSLSPADAPDTAGSPRRSA